MNTIQIGGQERPITFNMTTLAEFGRSEGLKIGEMLDILLGFSDVKITVKQDPERMRPSDVPVLVGDNSKVRSKTGWSPTIPFEKTMEDLLNYWRERVK